jgi:hypothetical protein
MPDAQGFDMMIALWGLAVLAFCAVRHIYFGAVDLPSERK